jgi:CBS domain-containing protein
MLRLSDHLKQDVLDADGARVGRLRDLAVELGEPFPLVTRLVVDDRVIAWDAVASFERAQVVLATRRSELGGGGTEPGELFLSPDILDCQIIDVEGKRVARVGDVELTRAGSELRCIAVETGLAPIARRLRLRRLAERLPGGAVAWENMHLTSGPGHVLQLESPAAAVHRLSPMELMHLVGRLSVERGAEVLQAVPPDTGAGALSAGRPELAAALLQALPQERASAILARMPLDDAASALRALEHPGAVELLGSLDEGVAGRIGELLEHAEGTAGAVMAPEAQTAPMGEPVASIRERIAAAPPALDGLLTVVRIDERRRPHGVLTATTLLAGDGEAVPVPAVRTDTPLDDVMQLFANYDVLAVPVVDGAGALVGVVAVDDILDELLAKHRPGERRYRVMKARRRAPS